MSINIKQISWEKKLFESRLEFEITGVNHTIVNTFRRVVLSDIPIYCFDNITITENTSIFNNNYMKLRLKNMPVIGIATDSPFYIPPKKKEVVETDLDVDISTDIGDLNSSSLKQLTMYIDYMNNTHDIVTVGTDDCKFYLAEKQIDSPYPTNIQIIDLQPKQNFKASVITQLGNERVNSIYSAVSIFTYKMVSDDTYIVTLESRGQLDEKTILNHAYENIRRILNDFLGMIPDKEDISGKLQMNNADHTLGNIISDGLRDHKMVKFGGYNSPHLLDDKIIFHYELKEKGNIKHIMTEIVSKYIDIFNTINKLINKNIN